MNFVRIGNGHQIIASDISSILSADKDHPLPLPKDVSVIRLCNDIDRRTVVVSKSGFAYITSLREDTIRKETIQILNSSSD